MVEQLFTGITLAFVSVMKKITYLYRDMGTIFANGNGFCIDAMKEAHGFDESKRGLPHADM